MYNIYIENVKESKTGNGISFLYEDKHFFINWEVLQEHKISSSNFHKLNGKNVNTPSNGIKYMYSVRIIVKINWIKSISKTINEIKKLDNKKIIRKNISKKITVENVELSGKYLYLYYDKDKQGKRVSINRRYWKLKGINKQNFKKLIGTTVSTNVFLNGNSLSPTRYIFKKITIENSKYKFVEVKRTREQKNSNVKKSDEYKAIKENNYFEVCEMKADKHQEKAIENAINNKVSIITGYAGTGKSSTVRKISEILSKDKWKISRVAPTGKASKVIGGSTIHSWLKPILEIIGSKVKITGYKRETFDNKECLIVDESSMMDDELWGEVKRVWNNSNKIKEKKIIFVGDQGQLKPVGQGEPFLNSIQNGIFTVTELKIIHRIKDQQELMDFVNKVRKTGEIEVRDDYKDIKFIKSNDAIKMIAENPSIQMLTPHRNYSIGSLSINKEIRNLIKTKSEPVFKTSVYSEEINNYIEHTPIYIGDKIIIIKNLWEWDVTNGTTGIFKGIERIDLYNHVRHSSSKKNCYKFLNTVTNKMFYLPVNKKIRTNIELAYAITIHKSQGSEYDEIIVYINGNKRINKRMLYTALTRAKKKIFIVL